MTKIANPRPPYCASCFSAVDARHVDFEAAYDGPVIPGSPEAIPVDDLIVCEPCLEEAFNLLDPQGKNQTIDELVGMVRALQGQLDSKDKTIQGLRASTNELIDYPVASFPGKPRLEGVPDDVRAELTRNKYKRRGTSPAPKNKKDATKEKVSA